MRIALIIIILVHIRDSASYRILGILPWKAPSHNMVMLPLFDELAQRGHDVHVVSYHPKKVPTANYTSLALELETGVKPRGYHRIDAFEASNHVVQGINLVRKVNSEMENAIKSQHIQRVVKEKWDAVIIEYFNTNMFASVAHLTGAPLILFHTSGVNPFQTVSLGEPLDPSYIPHPYTDYPVPMTFTDRLFNTIESYYHAIDFIFDMGVKGQKLAEKYLGPLPAMSELIENASLLLLNTHPSFHGSRPLSPSVVQIGGIHLKPKNPLPQDLLKILDESKEGVVFFSLGSVLRGDSISEGQLKAFVSAFSSLGVEVLWKYEGILENNPRNIHLNPWFPQRDILGHPKLLLFISHCGLLSIEEAITEGVPVICIPIFGDQFFNARRVETLGIGERIDLLTVTDKSLKRTIERVLTDPSYAENALKVKEAFNDRPMSPMSYAIYWVEYVVRHKGAPLLKSNARRLPFYQLNNLDVWAVLLGGALLSIYLSYSLVVLKITKLLPRLPLEEFLRAFK